MKKGISIFITIVVIALLVGAYFYFNKPVEQANPTGNESNTTPANNQESNPPTSPASTALTALSSDSSTSEADDAPVTSDSGVADSSGLN